MLTRRNFVAIAAASAVLPRALHAAPISFSTLPAAFEQIEKKNGGRLGVSVLDTGSNERTGYRADERFAFCSTFKVLLAAAVLHRVDTLKDDLRRQVDVPPKPLVGNSPLTEEHAGGSMTLDALCNAILTRSDNTAANVLLDTIGGPEYLTAYARSIGDTVTRLDRTETALNEAKPGDPRDTTSPNAMLGNLNTLLLGKALSPESRDHLLHWMESSTTGLTRIRAKLPKAWRAADKTGSNGDNTAGNLLAVWPTGKPPILVAAYITECPGPETKRNVILAEIGRLIAETIR
jgi:beta-lactamase class A